MYRCRSSLKKFQTSDSFGVSSTAVECKDFGQLGRIWFPTSLPPCLTNLTENVTGGKTTSNCLSVCFTFGFLFLCSYIPLFVYPYVCLFIFPSVIISFCLSVCLYFCLFVLLYIRTSVSLSFCLSVSLSVFSNLIIMFSTQSKPKNRKCERWTLLFNTLLSIVFNRTFVY